MDMTRRALMPLMVGLAASIAAEPAGATADGPVIFRVVDVTSWDVLNMRAGPGTRYRIVDTIPHDGSGIENLAAGVGNWMRVRYAGRIGWVNSRYLTADYWDDYRDPTWQVVGVAYDDVLNVRAGPSARAAVPSWEGRTVRCGR